MSKDAPRICKATKRNGEPCTLLAQADADVCWAHDSRNRDKRREATSRAGRKSALGKGPTAEVTAIRAEIRKLIRDVERDKINHRKAAVLTARYGMLRGWYETGLKIKEAEEMEARIRELEEALGGGRVAR